MGVIGPMKLPLPRRSREGAAIDESTSSTRRLLANNLNNAGADMFDDGNLDGALNVFNQALKALRLKSGEQTFSSSSAKKIKRVTFLEQTKPKAGSNSCVEDECDLASASANFAQGPPPKKQKRHQYKNEDEEETSSQPETADDGTTKGPQHSGAEAVPLPITPLSNIGMYREEEEEDLGTVCFNEPVRFAASSSSSPSSPQFPCVDSSLNTSSDAAAITYNLALVHRNNGSTDAALLNLERALSLLNSSSSPRAEKTNDEEASVSSPLLLAVLNNIGGIHFQAGRTDAAMRCFLRALQDGRELETEESSSSLANVTSTVTRQIAFLLEKVFLGNTVEESEARDQVVCTIGVPSDAWQLHQATTLSNVGQLLFRGSNFTEAMAACSASASIRRHVLGDDKPNLPVAVLDYNMGLIEHKLGNVSEAALHYEAFLSKARRPLSEGGVGDGPEGMAIIATARHQVGLIQGARGQTDEAIATLTDVLNLRRGILGGAEENADVAKTLFSIGQVHFEAGSHTEAMILFTQTLKLASRVLKRDHMIFVFTYSYVGQILHARGRLPEALKVYEEALAVAQRVFGDHSYILVNILNVMGNLSLASNEPGAAWNCFARASGMVVRSLLARTDEDGVGVVVTRCRKKVAQSA